MILVALNIAYLSIATVDSVAQVLAQADIACLNEADNNTERSARTHQAKALAGACGMYYRYGKSFVFRDGSSTGNAVLSKRPFQASRNVLLPFVDNHQRSALVADVDGFRIVCTHLNGGPLRNEERIAHIDRLDRLLSLGIICGDFNHTPDRDSHRHALTLWHNAGPADDIPSTNDRRDFIYLKGLRVRASRMLDVRVSDHKPLWVEL